MIDWERYGFKEDEEFAGCYTRSDFQDFPFMVTVDDACLTIYSGEGPEYVVSEKRIPATNRQVELLLKAFCIEF